MASIERRVERQIIAALSVGICMKRNSHDVRTRVALEKPANGMRVAGGREADLEALAVAGLIAVKGLEVLSGEMFALNQKVIHENLANAKRLLDCKTIYELAEVQADLAWGNFEQLMVQGARITEMAVKAGRETGRRRYGRWPARWPEK